MGRSRDVGPWSDLYGLGCLAWELASGSPPFRGRSIIEIGRHHLYTPLPALEPTFDVPDGFEAWLHRMLQKETSSRYRRAADAAWALMLLAEITPDERKDVEGRSTEIGSVQTHAVSGDRVEGDHAESFDASSFGSHSTPLIFESFLPHHRSSQQGAAYRTVEAQRTAAGSTPEGMDADLALEIAAPPIPTHWSDWGEPNSSLQLLGAGLQLYGLRRVPIYGRHVERDQLWDNLVHVANGGSAQMVLIDGPAGTGKSHLARWLCERASEVGAAQSLMAAHNPGHGGADGLIRLLETYFKCAGMPVEALTERLDTWFDRHEVDEPRLRSALVELLSPADHAPQRPDRPPMGARERCRLIASVLEYIGRDRTLILWLDDLHWSAETMSFVCSILESRQDQPLPILIVGTRRTDAPSEDPQAVEMLDELVERDQVTRLALEPLPMSAHADLIEQLLHLKPALARRVADRTAGNPLFAVQLIGDWIERGVLEASAEGFSLSEGEEFFVPDDLFSLWKSRLERVLEDVPDAIWPALELAAALGVRWLESEWQGCCAESGVEVRESDIEALLSHRLLVPTESGYAFAHSILRETLERHAREHGRWAEHNRSCARMLVQRGQTQPEAAERLGRYYVEGEQWSESLEPLRQAIKWRGNRRQAQAVEFLLDLRAEAIEKLELSEVDRARLQNSMLRALTFAHRLEYEQARELGERTVDAARRSGDLELLARALFRLGQIHQINGGISDALDLSEQALALVEKCVDPPADHAKFVDGLRFAIGELELRRGQARAALAQFKELSDESSTRTSDHDRAANLRMIGNCQRALGDFDSARDAIAEAADLYESLGSLDHLAGCLTLLGDVHRQAGEFDLAEPYYTRALVVGREGPRRNYLNTVFNLSLLEVAQGRFDSAFARVESLSEQPEVQNSSFLMVFVRCALLPCLASRGQYDRLDEVFEAVREEVEHHQIYDVDLAIPTEIAADLACDAGHDDRARSLSDFARAQRSAVSQS
jgi:tetratricopeptide (TPR) repeat protein